MALAVTVLTLASCGGHGSASTTTSTPPRLTVAVDTAATPAGWVPVVYGDAQISVPANWAIGVGVCDPTPGEGTVWLDQGEAQTPACPGTAVFILSGSAMHSSKRSSLNGVTVYWGSADDVVAPSLQVEVNGYGPLAGRVIRTLSPSPQAVALAPGPAPAIPSPWHRFTFGGLSVAVPSDWPVQHTSSLGGCGLRYRTLAPPSAVVFDTGTLNTALESCPGGPAEIPLGQEIAANGVVIDPGPYGPLQGNDSFGRCLHINDITACPTNTDVYGVLVLAMHLPSRAQPVAVEIGLAGNGIVARTILHSMRAG